MLFVGLHATSARLPGQTGLDELSALDGVRQIPLDRWDSEYHVKSIDHLPARIAAFLNGAVADFDADIFGIGGNEASLLDPQQRILLELAYEVRMLSFFH